MNHFIFFKPSKVFKNLICYKLVIQTQTQTRDIYIRINNKQKLTNKA